MSPVEPISPKQLLKKLLRDFAPDTQELQPGLQPRVESPADRRRIQMIDAAKRAADWKLRNLG